MKQVKTIFLISLTSFAFALWDSIHRQASSFNELSVMGKVAASITTISILSFVAIFFYGLIKKKK